MSLFGNIPGYFLSRLTDKAVAQDVVDGTSGKYVDAELLNAREVIYGGGGGGPLIQYGTLTTSNSGFVTITFPEAFANTNYAIVGAPRENASRSICFQNLTTTTVQVAAYQTSSLQQEQNIISWIAIGAGV